jgi:calcium binding protein
MPKKKTNTPKRAASSRPAKSKAREDRIVMEIIVDAYGPEEQAMGWYYYLEDKLSFPFRAKCTAERGISPLREGETVEVTGMAPEEDCQHEMFVTIQWQGRTLGVPLSQLKGVAVEPDTKQALEDWHYWIQQGYEF